MIDSEDGESDLKSSMQARRLFSNWRHSAGPMCTPPSSAPLVRARQCPCSFPFIGCIADAAGQGDPCTAEEAIASYKAPSTPVYHSCSFASPPGKGKFGMSANSPLCRCQLLTFRFLASAPRHKKAFNFLFSISICIAFRDWSQSKMWFNCNWAKRKGSLPVDW